MIKYLEVIVNILYNHWCMDADQSEVTQQQIPGVARLDMDFQLYSALACLCAGHELYVCCVCSVMSNFLWPFGMKLSRLLCPWDASGKNTGVGCHYLLQGIFPTQGLNPHLLHCRQILSLLSQQGSLQNAIYTKFYQPIFCQKSAPYQKAQKMTTISTIFIMFSMWISLTWATKCPRDEGRGIQRKVLHDTSPNGMTDQYSTQVSLDLPLLQKRMINQL